MSVRKKAFTNRSLLHTHTHTLLPTDASTHRRFYTKTLLHTDSFTHRRFYPQTLLHTDAFTHRRLYTHTPLVIDAFTHRHFYTQTLLHTDDFTHRPAFTHTDASTHRSSDKQTPLHTERHSSCLRNTRGAQPLQHISPQICIESATHPILITPPGRNLFVQILLQIYAVKTSITAC